MTIKTLISTVFLIIIATALGAYFTLSSNSEARAQSTLETMEEPGSFSNVGDDILVLLGQIESLNIDASIFQNPVYLSLTDFTVPIPKQNIGRVNPFAPFGGFTQTIAAPTSTRTTARPAGSR